MERNELSLLVIFVLLNLICPAIVQECENGTKVVLAKLLPIVSTNQTLTFTHNMSSMADSLEEFEPRWCVNGTNAEGVRWHGQFEKINSNQQTTLIINNPAPDNNINGLTVYLVNLSVGCNTIHKAVPIRYDVVNITANWFLLHIIEASLCPPLANPMNGGITYSNHSEGNATIMLATYFCNSGFVLTDGNAPLRCERAENQLKGEWSGPELNPKCLPLMCSELDAPLNGSIQYSEMSNSSERLVYGTRATYNCSTGFSLSSGDRTRVCQQLQKNGNDSWSGTASVCQEITCSVLDQPRNGSINQSTSGDFPVFGTVVTYSCDKGFTLVGENATRACGVGRNYGISGVWSGQEPKCEPIQCSPLKSIQNGNVTYNMLESDSDTSDPLPFGTVATCLCSEQYNITGANATRTCHGNTSKGEWSGRTPSCNITSDRIEIVPGALVGVVASTIPLLAILSVVFGLLGLLCGYKMRSIKGSTVVSQDGVPKDLGENQGNVITNLDSK